MQAENSIDCNALYNEQIDQILHYRPDPVRCARAKAKGVEVNDMVNDLLRKDIDLIEGIK